MIINVPVSWAFLTLFAFPETDIIMSIARLEE